MYQQVSSVPSATKTLTLTFAYHVRHTALSINSNAEDATTTLPCFTLLYLALPCLSAVLQGNRLLFPHRQFHFDPGLGREFACAKPRTLFWGGRMVLAGRGKPATSRRRRPTAYSLAPLPFNILRVAQVGGFLVGTCNASRRASSSAAVSRNDLCEPVANAIFIATCCWRLLRMTLARTI